MELKYPKERFVGTMLADGHPEEFDLASSGAPGDSAITFWKDLSRIETLIDSGVMKAGAAVVLSNCHYWKQGAHGAATQVYDFRLWEGRELPAGSVLRIKAGTTWAADASAELRAHYCCEWHPYSDLGKAEFRYLVLEPHQSSYTLAIGNNLPPAPNDAWAARAPGRCAWSGPSRLIRVRGIDTRTGEAFCDGG